MDRWTRNAWGLATACWRSLTMLSMSGCPQHAGGATGTSTKPPPSPHALRSRGITPAAPSRGYVDMSYVDGVLPPLPPFFSFTPPHTHSPFSLTPFLRTGCRITLGVGSMEEGRLAAFLHAWSAGTAAPTRRRQRPLANDPLLTHTASERQRPPRIHMTQVGGRRVASYAPLYLNAVEGPLPWAIPLWRSEPALRTVCALDQGVRAAPSGLPAAGLGLWTQRRFAKGDLVTWYDGPCVEPPCLAAAKEHGQGDEEEEEDRRCPITTHWKSLRHDLVIDGLRTPQAGHGGASFANDGRDQVPANVAYVLWQPAHHGGAALPPACYLRALRELRAGEELFVSYGRGYWTRTFVEARTLHG